jgi:hypothetical protein
MNTSSFVAPNVLASMQGLWRWFTTTPVHGKSLLVDTHRQPSELSVNSVTNISRCNKANRSAASISTARRPVRIIRVLEATQAPAQAGRMVMSGRMADVCAELDRLAARETALH